MGGREHRRPGDRAEELIGSVVSDRYRIVQLIALGGMAEVYVAEHIHIRKLFAIKVLRPEAEGFRELVARFEREAIAGANIDHDNVACATDFGWLDDGSAFLVLEYVQGATLRTVIGRGPLAPERARHIARQIAAALAACHELGVLHRDLKPGNVMIDEQRGDLVKLIDFGLAKVPVQRLSMRSASSLPPPPPSAGDDENAELTEEPTLRNLTFKGVVFGTVSYMAPEIALGMDAIDRRSDLYGLGVVLYEMLAGKLPFEVREPAELLLKQRSTPPPRISARTPGVSVPSVLEGIAVRLLSASPADRFQNADAVVAALDAVAPGASRASMDPQHEWPRASSTLRLMPAVVDATRRLSTRRGGLMAVVIAGAALALALWFIDRHAAEQAAADVPPASPGLADVVRDAADDAVVAPPPPAADPTALRKRFIDAHRRGLYHKATHTLLQAVEENPLALDDPEVRRRAATLSASLDYGPRSQGTELFQGLAMRAGPPGLDLLYEVLASWGGTPAAERATALLALPEVRARMTEPAAIAVSLRETRCKDKPALFEKAGQSGDMRALIYLRQLRSLKCNARAGECCFHGSRKLATAISAMERRLKKPSR